MFHQLTLQQAQHQISKYPTLIQTVLVSLLLVVIQKVQAETARIQHDWNAKHGIENPDGSETQNFQNWVSKRDQTEANGQSMPDYDQNQQY